MTSCCVWDFRANKDNFTVDDLLTWFKNNCKKYVFQLERGDTGYEHWQGRFNLIKKRQKHIILELIDNKFNYLAPTAKANWKDEYFYAMKEDTRIDGPYSSDSKDENYIPKQFRDIQLFDYQLQILKSAETFDPRTINYIYDTKGNNGKSTIAAIAELKYGGIDMPPLNDFKELIALACNICMDTKTRNPKIMFFDMPRAMNKDKLFQFYSAIEQIKKGKLYDMRYHYKAYWIDSPAIWVFSNSPPDMKSLSADRWKIWKIKDKKLIPYEPYQPGELDT